MDIDLDEFSEPIAFFRYSFTNEILQFTSDESNKYAIQINPNKPLLLTKDELEQFTGILYMMTIVRMPGIRSYWNMETRYEKIANIMSRNRFDEIKRFVHCNYNLGASRPLADPFHKFWPIVSPLKNIFKRFSPKEYTCIDEQVILFKGRSRIKQYNPNNPIKMGL